MTDDDVFFAAVCKQFGHPLPPMEAPDTKGLVAAAVIAKPRLVLATVQHPRNALCRFDEDRSRMFELPDRSARSITGLVSALSRFVQSRQISQVFLRSSSERGKYPGHALNFKIEAALQMVPGLQVTFVSSQSVGAWVRREHPAVPEGDRGLGAIWTDKQRQAIETALFAARNFERRECFSDGSADDD